jgi:hypothetical protein
MEGILMEYATLHGQAQHNEEVWQFDSSKLPEVPRPTATETWTYGWYELQIVA